MLGRLRRVAPPAAVAVVVVVTLLGAASASAILLLERRADASRTAQVSLAEISADLTGLELVPLSGAPFTAPRPLPRRVRLATAEQMFAAQEQRIRRKLSLLRRDSPPAELDRAVAPLDAAIATAREAVPVWVSNGLTAGASSLLARQGATLFAADGALSRANDAYGRRATALRREAVVGVAVVVALLLAAFSFLYWRSDRRRAELHRLLAQLERAQLERASLLERSVHVAEHERMRVAADLHDGPIQRLSAVALAVDILANQLDRGDTAKASTLVEQIRDTMASETVALRRLMTELRPPILDQRGLSAALRDCADEIFGDTDVECRLEASDCDRTLAPAIETIVFRVVREAFRNVRKHAPGAHVSVRLASVGDDLHVSIDDDGPGFTPRAETDTGPAGMAHFGLVGMRERVESVGGKWTLAAAPGAGTSIDFLLPRALHDEPLHLSRLVAAA